MLRYKLFAAALAAAAAAFVASDAHAQEFAAGLTGFQEVGALNSETGPILTDATGRLRLALDRKNGTIEYTLSYSSGFTSPIMFAHIHFGQFHQPGGIVAFLCTNETAPQGVPPPPACPPPPGSVSGTLTAANVLAVSGQNVSAGDFDALEDAITSNSAYANIHTENFKSGEIRGQIFPVQFER